MALISADLERRIRAAAGNRCGYCLTPQRLYMGKLEIEHLVPLSKGGSSEETNLWLSCRVCNGHKSDKTQAIDLKRIKSFRYSIHEHKSGQNVSVGATMVWLLLDYPRSVGQQ